MEYKIAVDSDIGILAAMNKQLLKDEAHAYQHKSLNWFANRIRLFLAGEYSAVIFSENEKVVGYALFREHSDRTDTIYLRQLFVKPGQRNRSVGRKMMKILLDEIFDKEKRISLEVLIGNQKALNFYASLGFKKYALELELPVEDR